MLKRTSIFVLAAALGSIGLAGYPRSGSAEDVYYNVPLHDLKVVEGRLRGTQYSGSRLDNAFNWRTYQRQQAMTPYAMVDRGEAYLVGPGGVPAQWVGGNSWDGQPENHLLIRAPEGKEVKGRLVIAKTDASGMDLVRFVVPASAAKAKAKVPFYRTSWPITSTCCLATFRAGPGFSTRSA